jgi:hypothetical protein
MKMKKRIISLVLALIMTSLSISFAVSAGDAGLVRYTVLVLDTSSSTDFYMGNLLVYTADTAISYVKESAKKFIADIQSANGTNYVAIVSYSGESATIISPFSTDLNRLTASINNLSASDNSRSIAKGLQSADTLISGISDNNAIKNVVLFTTGMTDTGDYNYNGHYDDNTVGSDWWNEKEINLYAYANVAYSVAKSLQSKATLHTIGLFQTMTNMFDEKRDEEELMQLLMVTEFFRLVVFNLASSPEYFYYAEDPNDLEFVFGEVASGIIESAPHNPDYIEPIDLPYHSDYNNDPPLVLSYSLAFAIKDVPYSYFLQNNGQTTYWEIGNTLSSHGLKLMPNGEIYGVPKNIGTLTFTVGATGYSVIDPKSHNPMNSAAEIKCTLNVLDSIDANIYIKSDPGYEFTVDNIIITEIRDYEFICNGPYANFAHHVYLNDIELIERGKNSTEFDYDVREGSSIITIYAPTFANKAKNGENILIMEFNEGSGASKTLKKGVLRFTLALGGSANNSGSSANDANNQQYDDKDNPKTGAETGVWFILALALLSSSRVARAYKRKKTI